jgi:hypothetical protein
MYKVKKQLVVWFKLKPYRKCQSHGVESSSQIVGTKGIWEQAKQQAYFVMFNPLNVFMPTMSGWLPSLPS